LIVDADALPSEYAGIGDYFLRPHRPIRICDQFQLAVGWAGLTCLRHEPRSYISLDFSRLKARGRSDLHSPNDAWTSQTHDSPGILQDRRSTNAAASPFPRNGVARFAATGRSGFASRATGLAGRGRYYASPLEICETRRVFHLPSDWQAPIFRQESAGRDSETRSDAVGRRERTALMPGHGSSWHAGNAMGRLTSRHWETADAAKWEIRQEICLTQTARTDQQE
jgi:hypothetical protein